MSIIIKTWSRNFDLFFHRIPENIANFDREIYVQGWFSYHCDFNTNVVISGLI